MKIQVRKPSEEELNSLGVKSWPIWEKEESSFDWHYDAQETCYFLEGEVEVVTPGGETVKITAGDLAVFPEGLSCKWQVNKKVRKHYSFD